MKITKSRLKQIIKEEMASLRETGTWDDPVQLDPVDVVGHQDMGAKELVGGAGERKMDFPEEVLAVEPGTMDFGEEEVSVSELEQMIFAMLQGRDAPMVRDMLSRFLTR